VSYKYFLYIDETGQDTRGRLFIVSVVVSASDREEMRRVCETIERETGKNRVKWSDASPTRRLAYMRQVLSHHLFKGRLIFAVYRNSRDHTAMTVETIARTLKALNTPDYEATVFIDALPRALERAVGLRLRRSGVHAKKVRGVRREQTDPLIRLADALCGFVRSAIEGQPIAQELLTASKDSGVCQDVTPK
jgi:hypothetical protein